MIVINAVDKCCDCRNLYINAGENVTLAGIVGVDLALFQLRYIQDNTLWIHREILLGGCK